MNFKMQTLFGRERPLYQDMVPHRSPLPNSVQNTYFGQLVQFTKCRCPAVAGHRGVFLRGHSPFESLQAGIEQAVDHFFLALRQLELPVLLPKLGFRPGSVHYLFRVLHRPGEALQEPY